MPPPLFHYGPAEPLTAGIYVLPDVPQRPVSDCPHDWLLQSGRLVCAHCRYTLRAVQARYAAQTQVRRILDGTSEAW